jgi:hypothetical protein
LNIHFRIRFACLGEEGSQRLEQIKELPMYLWNESARIHNSLIAIETDAF